MALVKLSTVPYVAPKMKEPKPPPADAMTPSNAGRSAQSTDAVNKYQ